jgi:hypothetical protein
MKQANFSPVLCFFAIGRTYAQGNFKKRLKSRSDIVGKPLLPLQIQAKTRMMVEV